MARGFDAQEYQRYVHRHQDEATRKKLRCVHAFAACSAGAIFSKEQIIYIVGHIESLVPTFTNQSPERE